MRERINTAGAWTAICFRVLCLQLTPEEQKCFSTWRYVSPQTLKVEMGISKEMDDMEANFKASDEEMLKRKTILSLLPITGSPQATEGTLCLFPPSNVSRYTPTVLYHGLATTFESSSRSFGTIVLRWCK